MAGWFLTWFVHEFPSLDDSMKIFDFQLMELSSAVNSREPGWSPEVYTAAGLILLHKEKIFNWQDDPFERVVYLRNLPKIASVDQVIECVLLIRAANDGKDLIIVKRWFLFIMILYIGMMLTN